MYKLPITNAGQTLCQVFIRIPTISLKAGYTAHSNFFTAMQVLPKQQKIFFHFPPFWVSTKFGSLAICRYGAPKNLNFQHKPRFGQPKPAPETSQMCPSALLTPSSRFKPTRILRLHKHIQHKIKKMSTIHKVP